MCDRSRSRLERVEPLFTNRSLLRAVVGAVLEGRMGRADVDEPYGPRVARLTLGCYAVFGGDAAAAGAERLVRDVAAPRELLFPDSAEWRALLAGVHGPRLSDRPMRAYDAVGLDIRRLEALAECPEKFTIRPLDARLAARLDDALAPHAMQAFDSPEHFAAEGMGFGALRDGQLACVATTYAVCRKRIELAIATRSAFRRRGLARAVAATLMLHCLRRDIVPEWSAANPYSQSLAEQLGYRPGKQIEIWFLDQGDTRRVLG